MIGRYIGMDSETSIENESLVRAIGEKRSAGDGS